MAFPTARADNISESHLSNLQTDFSYPSQLGISLDYGLAVYLSFVWLISIYANGVVLVGLARQRSQLAALDILIGNLALSNGLLALITYPFTIISLCLHKWPFEESVCLAYSFLMLFFGLIGIWTLLGIARVFHQTIKTNKNTANKVQQQQQRIWACRFIGSIIVVSWIFCILPLVGIGQYGPAKHGSSCTIDWKFRSATSIAYITCLMLAGFVAPLVGTITLYSGIISVLFTLKRAYSNPEFCEHWSAVQRKTLRMSIAICICMIVSWTPYSIVSIWETYGDSSTLPVHLEAFSAIMAKSSTAFSPLVHLLYTQKFRHWFKKFLVCICVCNYDVPVPTMTLVLSAGDNEVIQPQIKDIDGESKGPTAKNCGKITSKTNISLGDLSRTPSSVLRYIDHVVNEPLTSQRSTSFGSRSERKGVCAS